MNAASFLRHKGFSFLAILVLYTLIYFQTFTANYAYLDEIHQLWNNRDNSNRDMFLTQGRLLTGLLFSKAFVSLSTIEGLKALRLFSLGGWVLTTWLWTLLFARWVRTLGWPESTLWLSTLFVICSASVAICIGWASCMELFLAVAFGLLAGHVLFVATAKEGAPRRLPIGALLLSLSLGIVSLFWYQTAYGAFLLPFLCWFIKGRGRIDRVLTLGVGVYLLTYIIYYGLFQLSLQAYEVPASNRTGINLDVLGKIGFFFSGPLPQAFSLNWLYSSSSVVAQALYIVVFLAWVVSVFRTDRGTTVAHKLRYLVGVLLLLALVYLPGMIAKENFSSYRTLFVVNLSVFILVLHDLFGLVRSERARKGWVFFLSGALLALGFYNYNVQFINPVKQEYAALSTYFRQHYTADKLTVHFIRADRKLFNSLYGTRVIKDEFGAPSSSRDWVPEPLIRQFLTEMTGSREGAQRVTVVQYESRDQYTQAGTGAGGKTLLMDANEILRVDESSH